MSRITLKNFPVTPQTLLTTENLCFKQKSNFSEKVLPPNATTLYNHVQPCTTMYNHVQPCTTMYNHVQPCTRLYKVVQPCRTCVEVVNILFYALRLFQFIMDPALMPTTLINDLQ